jgi:hypothetical protein
LIFELIKGPSLAGKLQSKSMLFINSAKGQLRPLAEVIFSFCFSDRRESCGEQTDARAYEERELPFTV